MNKFTYFMKLRYLKEVLAWANKVNKNFQLIGAKEVVLCIIQVKDTMFDIGHFFNKIDFPLIIRLNSAEANILFHPISCNFE